MRVTFLSIQCRHLTPSITLEVKDHSKHCPLQLLMINHKTNSNKNVFGLQLMTLYNRWSPDVAWIIDGTSLAACSCWSVGQRAAVKRLGATLVSPGKKSGVPKRVPENSGCLLKEAKTQLSHPNLRVILLKPSQIKTQTCPDLVKRDPFQG